MSHASAVLTRCGLGIRARAPSLLFLGESEAAFEAIAPLLQRLSLGEQRVDCFLTAPALPLRLWLATRFPEFAVVPPPLDVSPARTAYLKRLKVRTLILLEREAILNDDYAESLRARAIPLVLLSGRGAAYLDQAAASAYAPELLLAVDRTDGKCTPDDPRLEVFFSSSGSMDNPSAAQVLERVLPLAGRNVKWENRGDQQVRRWVGQRLFNALERPYLAARLRSYLRRFASVAEVAELLGHPQTILCLGNGPSSEDPHLEELPFDTLFRVNHSWMERGRFTKADVVFTGGRSTFREVQSATFGVQDEAGEKVMLMTRGPGLLKTPVRYFVMSRLGNLLSDFDWGPHRPTNGAAMIAMAVALQPKRLIIAGVDLFRHPEGTYPGDKATPNAYTPAHTMDKELAFMFVHLDLLAGEVVIIGDALDREWQEHNRQKDRPLQGPSAI